MYVIQERRRQWLDKWDKVHSFGRFKEIAEARAVIDKQPIKSMYRIAEEYTVVRYKAVRE